MSTVPPTPVPPAPVPPTQSEFSKIWNWIKSKVTIAEKDLAAVLGSKAAGDLEAVGKTLLDSWVGPLATAAMADATDVLTGTMSVSKAVNALVASATSSGKSLTGTAAYQVIALLQNALPTSADPTVTLTQ